MYESRAGGPELRELKGRRGLAWDVSHETAARESGRRGDPEPSPSLRPESVRCVCVCACARAHACACTCVYWGQV